MEPSDPVPDVPANGDAADSENNFRIRFLFASGERDIVSAFEPDVTFLEVKDKVLEEQRKGDVDMDRVQTEEKPRLVWGGRLLRDEEVLKDVLVNNAVEHSMIVAASTEREPLVPVRKIATRQRTPKPRPPSIDRRNSPTSSNVSPGSQSQPSQPETQTATQAFEASAARLREGTTMSNLVSQVQTSALNPQPVLIPNPGYIAAYETLFYYTFLATNEIYFFAGEPELGWYDMRPAPLFPVEKVKEAAEAFLKINGIRKDGTLGEEMEPIEIVDAASKEEREGEEMLKDTERKKDAEGDEYIEVEVNGLPYKMMLPEPSYITTEQKRALGRYCAHRRMIKTLQDLLVTTPLYAPHTTRTVRITAQASTSPRRWIAYRRGYFMFRIPTPDFFLIFAIWSMAFWSLIKVGTVLYMFTRGIPRDDPKFLCLAGLAVGWWIWDCGTHLRRARASRRRAREAERARVRAARGAVPGQGRVRHREARPADGNTPVRIARPHSGGRAARFRAFWINIGIAYDRRILRLFYYTPEGNGSSRTAPLELNDRRIPGSDENLPHPPPPPSAFWRLFCLPLILFFATMVPALDTGRRSAILERERHMRLLVEKLTKEKTAKEAALEAKRKEDLEKAAEQASTSGSSQTAGSSAVPPDFFSEAAYRAAREATIASQDVLHASGSNEAEGSSTFEPAVGTAESQQPVGAPELEQPVAQSNVASDPTTVSTSPIMPRFLCAEAIAYYRRIIGTTERIDWEAERQAQAALLANNGDGANNDGAEGAPALAAGDEQVAPVI